VSPETLQQKHNLEMNFFLWHYSHGVRGYLTIWKRFIVHILYIFSVFDLLRTLFSPWHRDVTFKNWRGFDPLKSIRRAIENFFARFIGAFVRVVMISIALALVLGMACVGGMVFFLWLAMPVIFFASLLVMWKVPFAILTLTSSLLVLALSVWCYFRSREQAPSQRTLEKLFGTRILRRVLARTDIEESEVTRSDFGSQEAVRVLLDRKNVREENFLKALEWESKLADKRWSKQRFWSWENMRRAQPFARGWKYGYTPQLDRVSEEIHLGLSQKFPSMYTCARPKLLELMVLSLSRIEQNCVLIVGQPGSGRKTLIEWLIKRVYDRDIGGVFEEVRFLKIDIEQIIAEHESHPKRSVNELDRLFAQATFAGNIILIIDDMEYYVGDHAIKNGNPDIGPILEKYLPIPNFRLIASMSRRGFHAHAERGRGMLKSMEKIELEELETDRALEVLLDVFSDMEREQIVFTVKALRHIVAQSEKFNSGIPLPERAVDLAKEVLVYWKNHSELRRYVDSHVVDDYITLKTGIPAGALSDMERDTLMQLEAKMAERIIGQKRAVSQIAKSLRKARSEITGSMRPIGSFLFLGPTGVGKTETAKVLASTYFGGNAGMIRLDMSEFQSPASVEQLLDELEKADSGVLDIFLQILDEGFFTDAFGTKVRFNNLIIIATSNAGAPRIKTFFEEHPESDVEVIQKEVVDAIVSRGVFRVEFLNRFDGVIFFSPLKHDELERISEILLEEFGRDVWKNKRIHVTFAPEVASLIVRHGYDPPFGARSLKRFIVDTVEATVADRIIAESPEEKSELRITNNNILQAMGEE